MVGTNQGTSMSIHLHDILAICEMSCHTDDHIIVYDPGHQVIIPTFFPSRVRMAHDPHSFLVNQAALIHEPYLVYATTAVYSWMLIGKPGCIIGYNAHVEDLSFHYRQQYHLHFSHDRLQFVVPNRFPGFIGNLLVNLYNKLGVRKKGVVNVLSNLQGPFLAPDHWPAMPRRVRVRATPEKAVAWLEEKSGSQWVVKDQLDVDFSAAGHTNLVHHY